MNPIRNSIVLLVLVVWLSVSVVAVTWGSRFDWPDYVHVDYGFPLVWATHTLVTIAGPADIWNVDVTALIIDLAIWLGSLAIAIAVLLYLRKQKSPKNTAEP